ncbi:hypothetical protein GCWU000342_02282 [Shuttleworthella satelles DSM 14600]|uniref:Uncharacterized protein n=1 Tax=Shuttleworthella satelles DSM 14600 TaxID=626523 RepID=C4GDV8_9FIRM|nr:hypothetical protein GCWU000342_02282 [Shuttleworthia satelles DSM 14600]
MYGGWRTQDESAKTSSVKYEARMGLRRNGNRKERHGMRSPEHKAIGTQGTGR